MAEFTAPGLPAVCPDPDVHRTRHAASETTWRQTPEQRKAVTGLCSWCGGAVQVWDTTAAAADDDLRHELDEEARQYAWSERQEQ